MRNQYFIELMEEEEIHILKLLVGVNLIQSTVILSTEIISKKA